MILEIFLTNYMGYFELMWRESSPQVEAAIAGNKWTSSLGTLYGEEIRFIG